MIFVHKVLNWAGDATLHQNAIITSLYPDYFCISYDQRVLHVVSRYPIQQRVPTQWHSIYGYLAYILHQVMD